MLVQEKKAKGFTLLELMVVIAIISIISAAAYPGFTSWMKARQANAAIVKIKDLFTTINTQVQRGSYPFAQIYIQHLGDSDKTKLAAADSDGISLEYAKYPDGFIKVTTKGMGQKKLAQKRYNDDDWKNYPYERCKIETTDTPVYWDDDRINSYTSEKATVNIEFQKDAALCFSKDGTFYSAAGEFYKAGLGGSPPDIDSTLYVCLRSEAINYSGHKSCQITVGGSDINPVVTPKDIEAKYFYRITWSIFGYVVTEKWSKKENKWIEQ